MRQGLGRVCLGALAGLIALWFGQAGAEPLRVAVTPWTGFAMIDVNGQLTGFNVDIMRELCKRIAVECELVMMLPGEVIEKVIAGKDVDIAAAGLLRTPDRERRMLFTDRYWRSSSSFVARSGTFSAPTLTALSGRRVAATRGSRQADYVREHFSGVATVMEFPGFDDTLAAVAAGDADVGLLPTIAALNYLVSDAGHGMETIGDPLTEHGLGGDVAIALPLGREPLRDRLNQALRSILLDGRYDAINSRYFPFRIY
ncbi:MAG TPA: transporter substrate-binding domain-containing protein [Azospirillum sp.]|nr:transporter substrate-binding domain-containing protein [Azospirillum sp.]